jgi:hypothetical protein
MALRWVRTIDESPHMFSTREGADNDWLLYCGAWRVGRLRAELRPDGAQRIVFGWSLTGPHTPEAPLAKRGEASMVAEAKQQLVDAMRAWAVWAGVRTADGGGPVAPRWVRTEEFRPELLGRAEDPTTNWLLLSGGFVAGHVYRPAVGPRQDPHWMLLGTSPTECPGSRAGWEESIDAAKRHLLDAWQAWLEWAELA